MPLSATERSRRYREKLKQTPVLHEQYLQKEHERYEKRKAEGRINSGYDKQRTQTHKESTETPKNNNNKDTNKK